jgi:hypothetical protein
MIEVPPAPRGSPRASLVGKHEEQLQRLVEGLSGCLGRLTHAGDRLFGALPAELHKDTPSETRSSASMERIIALLDKALRVALRLQTQIERFEQL